jgi:NADH:ubiquinone oxidoreductase subunit 3 (subunit A)
MKVLLLNPPIAFILYLILTGILVLAGRYLAGPVQETPLKKSTYSSGEAPPSRLAAPGYRPFFVVALFFAVLHLGALVLGSSDMSPIALIYLVGLMLALLALIVG